MSVSTKIFSLVLLYTMKQKGDLGSQQQFLLLGEDSVIIKIYYTTNMCDPAYTARLLFSEYPR